MMAMMSIGRDGNFQCILMDTYESFEALRCCIRSRIFMRRFEMTLLQPYETAEALCRRRNKVSTAAKGQVVWADSRWHGPAMMSNGRDGNFNSIIMDTYESKGILMYTYDSVEALRVLHPFMNLHESFRDDICTSL